MSASNLGPLGAIFGRSEELAQVARMLDDGERLITVVGPPGIGKTTLASHAAAAHAERGAAEGGAWMVDLTAARSTEDVAAAIGAVFGVPPEGARIGHALAARGRMLVVLDNVEQIVEVIAGALTAWQRAAPRVQWIATSRELLRIRTERAFELAPLPAGEDAVRLLIERAAGYRPSEADRPFLRQIVEGLEGIPLAIELAATRLAVLGPRQLLERLPRLDLLAPGRRDASARQATLRAAIDWSWSLLRDSERTALAQCAVFRGGFDADAAEHVIRIEGGDIAPGAMSPLPDVRTAGGESVLDVLLALRDKSLVRADPAPSLAGETRLRLFESIREYAAEKLRESGANAARAAAERHARWYADAAERWAAAVHGLDGVRALQHLALDRDNLLAAVDAAHAHGDRETEARLVLALDPLLSTRGPSDRHLALLNRAVSLEGPDRPDPSRLVLEHRARAHLRRGSLTDAMRDLDAASELGHGDGALEARLLLDRADVHQAQGALDEARAALERAAELADGARDRLTQARVARSLGLLDHAQGRLVQAWTAYERAMTAFRAIGDRPSEAAVWQDYGSLRLQQGRLDEARAHYEQALSIARDVGDQRTIGLILGNLGILEQEHGRLEVAGNRFAEALGIFARLGDRLLQGHLLGYVAALCFEESHPDEARERYEDALALVRDVGDPRSEGVFLAGRGAVDATLGRHDAANEAFTQAAARLAEVGDPGLFAALDLHRGQLDAARGDWEAARARLDAFEGDDTRQKLLRASDDLRFALRMLKRAVVSRALVVAEDGTWFRTPGGERVDLATRDALRRIVAVLARRRQDAPGDPMPIEEIQQAGWPGERILAEAAGNRVGVALTSLRKLGLRDVLIRKGEGYLFDPDVPMVLTTV